MTTLCSEESVDGNYSVTKVDQILLNGNGIVMVNYKKMYKNDNLYF